GVDLLSWKGPILPPLAIKRYRRSQPALLRFDAAFRRPARFEHPDTRPLKATPDLPTSLEPSSVMVGEAGDFTSLIGIPLQSPVPQQARAFLLGRHHQHSKVRPPDPPLIGDGVCLGMSSATRRRRASSRGCVDSRSRAEVILYGRHRGAGLRRLRGTLKA